MSVNPLASESRDKKGDRGFEPRPFSSGIFLLSVYF